MKRTMRRVIARPDFEASSRPLPRGYGVAWVDFETHSIICYPIPFNLVLAWLRRRWKRLAVAPSAYEFTDREAEIAAHYDRGLRYGRRIGYIEGCRDSARAYGAKP